MEYQIESSIFPDRLQATVNEMLAEGWECQGGLVVTVDHGRYHYHQAMLNTQTLQQRMLTGLNREISSGIDKILG